MTVARETIIFIFSCFLGMWIGVIFDVFRIIRIAFPCGKAVLFVEDCIFVFLASVFTFFFSVNFSNGFIRGFVILGEFLGFIIYYFTLGVLVYKCSKTLIYVIKSFLRRIYCFFLLPIYRFFKYIYTKISRKIKHISQKLLSCQFGKKFHLKHR